MLQIEIIYVDIGRLSRSVTSRVDFAELLLQIETFVVATAKVPVPFAVVLVVVIWHLA